MAAMIHTGRARRRAAVGLAPLVLAATLAAPAGAAVAHRPPGHASAPVRVAAGVAVRYNDFRVKKHRERAVLVTVDLTQPGVRLAAVTSHNQLNRRYQTVPRMARMARAVAGINADFFDLTVSGGLPRGGLVSNGVLLKSPQPGFERNFYVTKDGRAGIGAVPFSASLAASDGTPHSIYSVNNPATAFTGSITLITPALPNANVTGCTVVYGHTQDGVSAVDLVEVATRPLPALAATDWVLAACGSGGSWLTRHLHPVDEIALSYGISGPPLQTLVSGGQVLIRNGKRYADPHGTNVGPNPNPETFACVSRGGRRVKLGVIDGRSTASHGVTYGQLAGYLKKLGCWSGLAFDGGGSSTLVARTGARATATLQNDPSDSSGARHVTNGLFVLTR
jgi:phosphodiester glycosidase